MPDLIEEKHPILNKSEKQLYETMLQHGAISDRMFQAQTAINEMVANRLMASLEKNARAASTLSIAIFTLDAILALTAIAIAFYQAFIK